MAEPLTKREVELWHALKAISSTVQSMIDGELGKGISGADFGILSRLEDIGNGRLSQAQLLTSLRWDKSRLSHQLSRMEDRGRLKRERQPEGVIITLLSPGKALLEMARPLHANAVRRHLTDRLTDEERTTLLALAKKLVP